MAFLSIAEMLNDPSGLWELLILKVFSFITDYGWRILFFTVCLKLLMVPLDLYQRIKMRKNQLITERMAPALEKLKQQYGSNKQVFSQKQMELNKKEGFSYFSSCLPMIVTMVIFFYLFSGLNNISQYKNLKQYAELYDAFTISQTQYKEGKNYVFGGEGLTFDEFNAAKPTAKKDGETDDEFKKRQNDWATVLGNNAVTMSERAKTAVVDYYDSSAKESFLWIKNIWSPDVPWTKPILNATAFERNIGNYSNVEKAYKKCKIDEAQLPKSEYEKMLSEYDMVTDYLAKSADNKVNGLLILPILSIGLSFLSQFITNRLQKKSGQTNPTGGMGGSMKMMMFIMPVMMGFFALQYTSAFTLYIVVNSGMTILINVITTLAMNNTGKSKLAADPNTVIKYGRPDPNDNTGGGKKKKSDNGGDAVKYGRPDPNELTATQRDQKAKEVERKLKKRK